MGLSMMEVNETIIKELETAWTNLYNEANRNRRFKVEVFERAFSQTYSLLKESLEKRELDKQWICLIAKAYLFAKVEDDALEDVCLAAAVLTERMLNSFAFRKSSAEEASTIYLIESREEILLDFNDVNESISRLVKIYEEAYWRKVNI